jgi:hypothetical protein
MYKRAWTTQPPAGTPIDWDNPLTQDLIALGCPSWGALSALDPVTGGIFYAASSNGPPRVLVGPSGLYWAYQTGTFITGLREKITIPKVAIEQVSVCIPLDSSGSNMAGNYGDDTFAYGTNSSLEPSCQIYGSTPTTITGSTPITLGEQIVLGISAPTSISGTTELLLNGNVVGTGTGTVNVGSNWTFSAVSGIGNTAQLKQVYLTLAWGRQLGNAERQQFVANPWQIFRKRQRFYSVAAPPESGVILPTGTGGSSIASYNDVYNFQWEKNILGLEGGSSALKSNPANFAITSSLPVGSNNIGKISQSGAWTTVTSQSGAWALNTTGDLNIIGDSGGVYPQNIGVPVPSPAPPSTDHLILYYGTAGFTPSYTQSERIDLGAVSTLPIISVTGISYYNVQLVSILPSQLPAGSYGFVFTMMDMYGNESAFSNAILETFNTSQILPISVAAIYPSTTPSFTNLDRAALAVNTNGILSTASVNPLQVGTAGNPINEVITFQGANTVIESTIKTAKYISTGTSLDSTILLTTASYFKLLQAFNNGTTAAFLKVYDKSTAPTVGTDVPITTVCIPAGRGALGVSAPIKVSNGLSFVITANPTDSDTTAVAANQVVLNFVTA